MKNWLKKNIYQLCATALSFSFFLEFCSFSNFLFGEPEFPYED